MFQINSRPYFSLNCFQGTECERLIHCAKNKQTANIEEIFQLMLTGTADCKSAFSELPLDVIAEVLNNGFTAEEKDLLSSWCSLPNTDIIQENDKPADLMQEKCCLIIRGRKQNQSALSQFPKEITAYIINLLYPKANQHAPNCIFENAGYDRPQSSLLIQNALLFIRNFHTDDEEDSF